MTESIVIDRDRDRDRDLAAMRAELDRMKQLMQRGAPVIQGPGSDVDAIAASDFRRMTGPDLDMVPRSSPLGYLEGATWEQRQRLKMEAIAKSMGGRRDSDPIIPSIYNGGWTAAEEHRWEFALGLRSDVPDPLDRPEKPGTQNAQHPRDRLEVQARQGRRPAS